MPELTPESPNSPVLLEAVGLSYHFDGQAAVKNFDLKVERGEVLGLVGLNGAGKSTALRMLCGLLAPGSGTIRIGSYSLMDQPAKARQQLGYLPDPPALHGCLKVSEAIDINARLHGMGKKQRTAARQKVLEQCQLESVQDKPIAVLSKGFKQRTGLALALVNNPSVLILDEPASGLDPAQTQNLNALIKELAQDRAVIFSSHAIADVQSCCSRVALMQNGELVQDQQRDIKNHDNRVFQLELRETISSASLLALPSIKQAQPIDPHTWQIELEDDNLDVVITAALSNNWGIRSLTPQRNGINAMLSQLNSKIIQPEAA